MERLTEREALVWVLLGCLHDHGGWGWARPKPGTCTVPAGSPGWVAGVQARSQPPMLSQTHERAGRWTENRAARSPYGALRSQAAA